MVKTKAMESFGFIKIIFMQLILRSLETGKNPSIIVLRKKLKIAALIRPQSSCKEQLQKKFFESVIVQH